MALYQAYGCVIDSSIRLPFLKYQGPSKKIDLTIRIKRIPDSLIRRTRLRDCYSLLRKTIVYEPYAGKMIVQNGNEILVDPNKDADPTTLAAFLSPKIGVALHQKGFLMLHASAVEINGHAVAFLGGPHWGKSTTVAMLNRLGYRLITDDALAIRFKRGKAYVYPGYPRIKLWPETLKLMDQDPRKFSRLYKKISKRVVDFKENFDASPLPLGALYVLDKAGQHSIRPLSVRDAFMECTKHNYTLLSYQRFGIGSQFKRSTRLAKTVPFFQLRRRMGKKYLPSLIKLVQDHANKITKH